MISREITLRADQCLIEEMDSAQHLFEIIVNGFVIRQPVFEDTLLVSEDFDKQEIAGNETVG